MNTATLQPIREAAHEMAPLVGRPAPDFELPCTRTPDHPQGTARLRDYRGRWLILMFYPRDFSLVCPTEISAMSRLHPRLVATGADVLAVSTDSLESHQRWIATDPAGGGVGPIAFPLGSDVDGEVSRGYRVCAAGQCVALRGLFIVDPNSVVQYEAVHNMSVGRRTEDVLRVLTALQTGGLCAESWVCGANLDPLQEIRPGSVVSHYHIERKIGEGGFSAVYEAHDRKLQRKIAVKILRRQDERTQSILEEARAAAALNHPNVCTVHAVDGSEGVSLIVMELLQGTTLHAVVADGPLSRRKAAGIVSQVAAGMAAAHDAGVVHGDLKPANVFLTESGTAKIIDFGLAKRRRVTGPQDPTSSLSGPVSDRLRGTPSYMSPEQADGNTPTAASDLFSLGLILYELLTGQPAFAESNTLRVLRCVRTVDPERLAADVDEAFRPLLLRLLARDPAARVLTMREAESELRALRLPEAIF